MERLIIPGILTDSHFDLGEKVHKAQDFARRISIDVIDGLLVENKTPMPDEFSKINIGSLKVDVQLMVKNPDAYVPLLGEWGAERVFGHVEGMEEIESFLISCERAGVRAGVGLDLETPIEPWMRVVERLGAVLLMMVPMGHSGQEFDGKGLEKVKELREHGFRGNIVLDGGMNVETIPQGLRAGANQFSVTSDIWRAVDPGLRYQQLSDLLVA